MSAGDQQPPRRRIRWVRIGAVVVATILVGSFALSALLPSPSQNPLSPAEKTALDGAMNYLVNNYNPRVEMIPASPASSLFLLYPDNYIASLAFLRYSPSNQTYYALSVDINLTLLSVGGTLPQAGSLSAYSALNSSAASFGCPNLVALGWYSPQTYVPYTQNGSATYMTVLNDGPSSCSTANYADEAFLQAVHLAAANESVAALQQYQRGAADFDGKGLVDLNNQTGVYRTSDLALYIYSASCLGQTSDADYASLMPILLGLQDAASGEFAATYGASLHGISGGGTTLATALAALALEAVGNPSAAC